MWAPCGHWRLKTPLFAQVFWRHRIEHPVDSGTRLLARTGLAKGRISSSGQADRLPLGSRWLATIVFPATRWSSTLTTGMAIFDRVFERRSRTGGSKIL